MAKSRTLSANICSSSDRTVRGAPERTSVGVVMAARILSRAHGSDEVAEIGVLGRDADGVGEVVIGPFRVDSLRVGGIVCGVGVAAELRLDQRGVDPRLDGVGGVFRR